MQLDINGQYKNVIREQAKLKRMIEKNDQRLELLGKQLKHANDIKIARSQKKVIPLEKVLNELGL